MGITREKNNGEQIYVVVVAKLAQGLHKSKKYANFAIVCYA